MEYPLRYSCNYNICLSLKYILKLDNRKLFDLMLDGAYELTKNKIITNKTGHKKHIKEWITEFTEVDNVMRSLMELENGKNYTDDEFSMFLLEMGILFDKYFLTPYGYYFKLINPTTVCLLIL